VPRYRQSASPIECGGAGQIAGAFTVEEANELAIRLRAGELPRRLVVIEEHAPEP